MDSVSVRLARKIFMNGSFIRKHDKAIWFTIEHYDHNASCENQEFQSPHASQCPNVGVQTPPHQLNIIIYLAISYRVPLHCNKDTCVCVAISLNYACSGPEVRKCAISHQRGLIDYYLRLTPCMYVHFILIEHHVACNMKQSRWETKSPWSSRPPLVFYESGTSNRCTLGWISALSWYNINLHIDQSAQSYITPPNPPTIAIATIPKHNMYNIYKQTYGCKRGNSEETILKCGQPYDVTIRACAPRGLAAIPTMLAVKPSLIPKLLLV